MEKVTWKKTDAIRIWVSKLNRIRFLEFELISFREDRNSERHVRGTNLHGRTRPSREIPPRFITSLLERSLINIAEEGEVLKRMQEQEWDERDDTS